MPHPTRQVGACINCRHALRDKHDDHRARCNHPESPVDLVSGMPSLCKYGRVESRHGGWCGPAGSLYSPRETMPAAAASNASASASVAAPTAQA